MKDTFTYEIHIIYIDRAILSLYLPYSTCYMYVLIIVHVNKTPN